ncbi:MAG: hypothetical protein ACTHJL_07915 [Amnibacterium sp.]
MSAPTRPTGRPTIRTGGSFLRSWVPAVAAAELVGFLAPVAVGVTTSSLPWRAFVPLVLAAGAVEGAVLGSGQALVLRRALPALDAQRWIGLTALGALLAYAVVAPGTWIGAFDALPTPVRVALLATSALVLLVVLGGAQWLELRRRVRLAWTWILWVALAWLVALGAFLAIATPLWQPGQPVWLALLIGVLAGVVMAVVQALITGLGMRRLLTGHRPARTPSWERSMAVRHRTSANGDGT